MKRQRKPRSAIYRNAWESIAQAAVCKEKLVHPPMELGQAGL
ncbi:hypothetical protein [Scytonema sp. NUACC21]